MSDTMYTLNAVEQHAVCTAKGVDIYNLKITGNTAPTVTAAAGGVRPQEQRCLNILGSEIAPTLTAGFYKQVGTTQDGLAIAQLRRENE